jgi:hypothetical protein
MNTIETVMRWAPHVLARSFLAERRWAYLLRAPFNTQPHFPDLFGLTLSAHLKSAAPCRKFRKCPSARARSWPCLGKIAEPSPEASPT